MTIQTLLYKGITILKKNNISSADLDAEVLLSHILDKPREYLFSYPHKHVPIIKNIHFLFLIFQRIKQTPIAYLTHSKDFFALTFYVNKYVLVPRPETELLVQKVLDIIKEVPHTVKIIDIGTGSGCIPISILKNTSKVTECIATDISSQALKVARSNAKKHNLEGAITFVTSDLLNELPDLQVDILISNPPYLTPEEHIKSPSIQKEPKIALTDGNNGLSLYKKLFQQIMTLEIIPRYIVIEIGETQSSDILKLAQTYISEHLKKSSVYKDLGQKNRLVVLETNRLDR